MSEQSILAEAKLHGTPAYLLGTGAQVRVTIHASDYVLCGTVVEVGNFPAPLIVVFHENVGTRIVFCGPGVTIEAWSEHPAT